MQLPKISCVEVHRSQFAYPIKPKRDIVIPNDFSKTSVRPTTTTHPIPTPIKVRCHHGLYLSLEPMSFTINIYSVFMSMTYRNGVEVVSF